MEYIDGEDLRVLLRRIGRLPHDKGVEIAQQMCAGLAAAHERSVLHRDLKPANIMIDGRGQVRITDFGLAKVLGDGVQGEIAGTPAYMAPEQLQNGETSERSDLYSLGLILAELFLGKPVNKSGSVAELVEHYHSSSSSVDSLSSVDVDPAVERVIHACLQRDPKDRPSSARQLAQALPGGDPLEAAVAAGTTPSPELVFNAPTKERIPLLVSVGLLCVVVLGIAAAVINGRRSKRMIETSPQVLSARCAEIVKTLGYSELPKNTRYGAQMNFELKQKIKTLQIDQQEATLKSHSQPLYQFWQRWTDGVYEVEEFHAAFVATAEGPIVNGDREATVIVDKSGHLIGLKIVGIEPEVPSADNEQVDWSTVMSLAGLESSDVVETSVVAKPPIFCTELVAWEVGTGEQKRVIHVGALAGQCNYFEVIGLQKSMQLRQEPGLFGYVVGVAIPIFFMLIAWVNVRASRADWNGAMRASLLIFGLYSLQEVLAIRLQSPALVESLVGLLHDRAWGHMAGHAFFICIIYLGIEPYVRRFWPRSLVGFSRALCCKWTDQIVGNELLIGVSAGALAGIIVHLVAAACNMSTWEPIAIVLTHPTEWLAGMTNQIASMFLGVFALAATCVFVRVFARRLPFVLTIFSLSAAVTAFQVVQNPDDWMSVFQGLLTFAMLVLLFTRIGMLAAYAGLLAMTMLTTALPVNIESWYAGYAIASLMIPSGLALLGFVTSQGGVAKLLSFMEPQAERA